MCCLDDGRRASRTHEPQGRGLAALMVGVGGLPDRAPYPFQMTEHGCTRFAVSCGPAESSLQPIEWLSSICSKVRTYSGQVMPMWNLVLLAPRANQRRWSKVTGTDIKRCAECTPCHQSLACIIAVAVSHTYPLASFFLVGRPFREGLVNHDRERIEILQIFCDANFYEGCVARLCRKHRCSQDVSDLADVGEASAMEPQGSIQGSGARGSRCSGSLEKTLRWSEIQIFDVGSVPFKDVDQGSRN